ncbi:MAG: putative long-chain-fatty-acid--CoA ligase [Tardiphaga sp.]|nr:putative long-chain-fatty-acid--CoA ligase [Tardiphaga sp.]MDB5573733.1 putative long-chain-fatty-acid--CoA ligase [Tardiphaga sp.]
MTHPGEQHYPDGITWHAPMPRMTLPALLDASAVKFKDRIALEFRDRAYSYPDLKIKADGAAAAFLRAGLGRNTSIALFLGNTPDHPVSFFGALKAGARIVHLSALDGEIALAHKLSDSGARVLVTSNLATLLPMALKFLDRGLLDRLIVCADTDWGDVGNATLPLPSDPRIVSWQDFAMEAQPPAAWPAIDVDDVAVLQYTGGTTGLPKGAMLSHGNLMAASHQFNLWGQPGRLARGDKGERVICVLPLFHIYALLVVLLRAVEIGDTVSLHQRFDVEAVMRDIEVKRATVFPGVPTMWIAIANLPDIDSRDLSSLVLAGSGGAPLPVEVASVFQRKTGLSLKSGWGMTETCGAGTSHSANGPDKSGSIGVAMPGIEMDIVSAEDSSKVLGDNETGEIRIKGPNVTRGYWNRPQDSATAFVGEWFLTGDIGYRDADGYYFIVDRKKDMILSGGFNVYPQMIEQAIYTHPAVQEVIVIGIPDPYRGEAAKAFVTLKKDASAFTVDDLRGFLSGKLGKHELPAAVEFVSELPRTPVGKLSRHELRSQQPSVFPSTDQATGGRS